MCLALTSCGGDDKQGDADDKATSTPSPTPTSPTGTTLTEPGTELAFGQPATVRWTPTQELEGYLTLTVDNALQGSVADLKGFNLDTDYKKNANYYFVNVTVANAGDTDLSERDVPLNGVNDKDTLLPPVVFNSAFQKCPTAKMPKGFVQGQSFKTCLVFLSPDQGPLTAVAFSTSPTESITWTGTVETPAPPKKKKQQSNG